MSANAGSGGLLHPVAQAFRGFSRYLQGVMGADAYRKYLEHHEACGHPVAPMTEKQF